jgi:hypothetical protein
MSGRGERTEVKGQPRGLKPKSQEARMGRLKSSPSRGRSFMKHRSSVDSSWDYSKREGSTIPEGPLMVARHFSGG